MSSPNIRTATADDAPALARIYEPYVRDTFISFEETAPTPDEMAERVRRILPRYPFLVFASEDQILGYAYACEHKARAAYRWSIDVSVYVDDNAHRRGIGHALYSKLLDITKRQGFHSAYAGIALPNHKSVGLHEAMGFTHIGTYIEVGFKHGAWRDVGWWRLPLSDGAPSGDPLSSQELG